MEAFSKEAEEIIEVCLRNLGRLSAVIFDGDESTFSLDFAETWLFGAMAAKSDEIGGDVAKKSCIMVFVDV